MIATTEDLPEISVSRQLKCLLSGRVCILGVGNRHRRDDGVGSLIAERLAGRTDVLMVDAGDVPENFVERVARSHPDTILILDAVDFGGAPGEFGILDLDSIGPSGLSTHALSLQMAADYLRARTPARVALLAIQPQNVGPGSELSEAVSRAVGRVQQTLSDALQERVSGQDDQDGGGIRSGESG